MKQVPEFALLITITLAMTACSDYQRNFPCFGRAAGSEPGRVIAYRSGRERICGLGTNRGREPD